MVTNDASSERPRIPLRDFFKNPLKTAFQISPDGNYLSFMGPYQNRMNIFVQQRGVHEAIRVTGETARDITDYFWKGNNRIIYRKDFKGNENYHLFSVDRDGRNLKDLTPFEGVRAEIIDKHTIHETEMLIGLNKRDPQVFDAYRLNVKIILNHFQGCTLYPIFTISALRTLSAALKVPSFCTAKTATRILGSGVVNCTSN
ncbi:MAG TPA: hypothetical protein VF531_06130 [Bacillota bacterium]